MTDLRFRYDKVIQETRSFVSLFRSFVNADGERPEAIWENLQYARERVPANQAFTWAIGDPSRPATSRPIRTRISTRPVEGGEWGGAHAEFFMLWRLVQGSAVKRQLPADFRVESASSQCLIWEEVAGAPVCVAKWNIDIGDVTAPGCRFHVQAHEQIEVPRFPSMLILPSDTLAFIANELFPKSWPTKVAGSSEAKFHGPLQSSRLAKLLELWTLATRGTADPFGALQQTRSYASLIEAQ